MKFVKITSLLLAALLVMSGCGAAMAKDEAMYDSGGMNLMETTAAMDADYFYADSAPMPETAMESESYYKSSSVNTSASATESGVNDLSERKIIKNANLEFQTKEYDSFMSSLSEAITTSGGYISSQSAHGGGEYDGNRRYANLTVRIPASGYDRFMEKASGMSSLTYKSESTEDVTMSYVDTESHIRALETEYAALLQILEKAESLEDVIQLQSRITEVNYQLDRYKSQLRKYDDLIAYCTVNISVSEVFREVEKPVEKMTFGQRIASAMNRTFYNIADDAQDLTVEFLASLPYLLIWAVVLLAVFFLLRFIWKKLRRQHEIRKLDKLLKQSQSPEPPNQKN